MQITQQVVDEQTVVIALDGILNAATADQLKQTFHQVAEAGVRMVVLDMSKVHFIDSAGLAVLIAGSKMLGGGNQCLQLASLQSQAQTLFKLTMFDKVFGVHADVASALKACRG